MFQPTAGFHNHVEEHVARVRHVAPHLMVSSNDLLDIFGGFVDVPVFVAILVHQPVWFATNSKRRRLWVTQQQRRIDQLIKVRGDVRVGRSINLGQRTDRLFPLVGEFSLNNVLPF